MDKKIIFCNCGGNLLKPGYKEKIFETLNSEDISFVKVSDLCGVSTYRPEELQNVMNSSDEVLVVACYSRGVKLLLEKAGVFTNSCNFLNFLEFDPESLLKEIKKFHGNGLNISFEGELQSGSDWPAWFPVIDYSRCTSCGQCADFCLFGVYEKRDKKVYVVNPEGCKNNCPACARICPHTAIIFPKYEHGGAIGGADTIDEIEEQQRQQKDIDAILGSEIFQALEKRRLKRQSIIRNNAMNEAVKERERALNEKR